MKYWHKKNRQIQFSSVAQLCLTFCDPVDFSMPGLPVHHSNSYPLSRWCHPTISSSVIPFSSHLQSFPASGSFPMIQFFISGSQSIGSFSFNISLSNEYSGLISFRMDWLDLLGVQGTLKSLLQHHSSKASIHQRSASFIVQLSHPLEWKLTFSSPVATAEFSKFAGILSAALSQHHLLGFEIAQLEFHHLHYLCS